MFRKRPVDTVDEGDDAESTNSKRKHTPKVEVSTMLDLTQPVGY